MKNLAKDIDLDLRGTVCPMAFVKLRLFADRHTAGETFTAVYEDTPANDPLIRTIEGVGHRVVHNRVQTEAGLNLRIIQVEIAR